MIKNWTLFLESNGDVDNIKDAFVNLEDEYYFSIYDNDRGSYDIYLSVGFDLKLECEYNDVSKFGEKLEKINRLNYLIKEAISKLENVKYKVVFSTSEKFEWSKLRSEIKNDREFYNHRESLVWIRLKEKTLHDKLWHDPDKLSDPVRRIIINSDELEKIINKFGFNLVGTIHMSESRYDNNTIKFFTKERVTNWDTTGEFRSESLEVISDLKSKFRGIIEDIWSDDTYVEGRPKGVFYIQFDSNLEIDLESV